MVKDHHWRVGSILSIWIAAMILVTCWVPSQAYGWFPSGDWWAIDDSNHIAWAIEDQPSQGKVKWKSRFHWTENHWPEDHWWPPDIPVSEKTWVDEWYMHEFRRFEYQNYGDAYDYDVMDADLSYYTTLPPPHEIEREERTSWPNWFWDYFNNDEEVEVICKEPCDIVPYNTYLVRVTFTKKSWYDDYMMVLESEHGNFGSSPPDDWKEIERINYVVPSALGISRIGTTSGIGSLNYISNPFPTSLQQDVVYFQRESPVLDVIREGGKTPYSTIIVQGNYSMKLFVSEYAHIASQSHLDRFVSSKMDELSTIEKECSSIDAIISFNQVLSYEELLSFQNQYDISIDWLRYTSTIGGGKIDVQESDNLTDIVDMYSNPYKEEFGSHFELVEGVGAIRAIIPYESLSNLAEDERVILIDRGPIQLTTELSIQHPDTEIVFHWYDIYQEYVKLNE